MPYLIDRTTGIAARKDGRWIAIYGYSPYSGRTLTQGVLNLKTMASAWYEG